MYGNSSFLPIFLHGIHISLLGDVAYALIINKHFEISKRGQYLIWWIRKHQVKSIVLISCRHFFHSYFLGFFLAVEVVGCASSVAASASTAISSFSSTSDPREVPLLLLFTVAKSSSSESDSLSSTSDKFPSGGRLILKLLQRSSTREQYREISSERIRNNRSIC